MKIAESCQMSKKLSKKKVEFFKKQFIEQKKNILNQISRKSKDDELDFDGDDVDMIQGITLQSLLKELSNRDLLKIKNIDKAMKKIELGCFGICESCDELIMEKRLLARPEADYCIDCAEEVEKFGYSHFEHQRMKAEAKNEENEEEDDNSD